MGAIGDTRQVLQDFLAPELRAIDARLTALENKVDENERRAEKRHDEMKEAFMDMRRRSDRLRDDILDAVRQVIDFNALNQRVAKLESKELAHQ